MVAVYRHDVHKLRGRAHNAATDELAGVPVNEPVPLGADRDAALLSRPDGDPEQTVDNHLSPARLSLLTGEPAATEGIPASTTGIRELITPTDPEELHATWLTSPVPARFNEAIYYPYTSLKYHTLLTAALLENYRAGHAFADLWLVATEPDVDASPTGATTDVIDTELNHRTVLWTPAIALHITADPGDRPAARLGAHPTRSFADSWARLSGHPFDTDGRRRWRLLDAQLRRIRSWSTALQYVEAFVTTHGQRQRQNSPTDRQRQRGGRHEG
ncbi:hypothetical protein NDO75_06215 [Natrinema sp. 1APR25-10V2]|nr:hypothetical protein [Natrinema sp. 1APR25-10V2]